MPDRAPGGQGLRGRRTDRGRTEGGQGQSVGGFALRIDSNRKLLDNLADIAWNGLPLDYLDTWTQQVEKVSVADIKAAFARKLQPDKMVTVILGAAK